MAEVKTGLGGQQGLRKAAPGSRWRNAFMATGFFCLLVSLFLGATMKEAAGVLPKFIFLAGIVLIAISGIGALIGRISHKGSGGPQATD